MGVDIYVLFIVTIFLLSATFTNQIGTPYRAWYTNGYSINYYVFAKGDKVTNVTLLTPNIFTSWTTNATTFIASLVTHKFYLNNASV